MHIRKACQSDTSFIGAVGRVFYPSPLHETGGESTIKGIVACNQSWVSVVDKEVVGFVLVSSPTTPFSLVDGSRIQGAHLFIHDLCVAPAHRACGIGKALAQRALSLSEGYASVSLVSLEGAVWFWVQFGFGPSKLVATWNYQAEYGEGAMLMTKLIHTK